MAKPINWSNDGVIFINFLKPLVKLMIRIPLPVKVIGISACIVGTCVYVSYRSCEGKKKTKKLNKRVTHYKLAS